MKNYKATRVSVKPNGYLLMKGGIWENGIWQNGTWETGTWEEGVWWNGTWKNGTWEWGTWEDGIWEDGKWKNGIWQDGIWQDGIWEDGAWEKGWILDPDRKGNFEKDWKWIGDYVRSPISPKKYFAKKEEKPLTKEETISVTGIVEINGEKYKLVKIT